MLAAAKRSKTNKNIMKSDESGFPSLVKTQRFVSSFRHITWIIIWVIEKYCRLVSY